MGSHAQFRLPGAQSSPDDLASSVKRAMRLAAGGVSVITAGSGDDRTGATVTTATSLSLEPPTMIVNINVHSSTWSVIQRYGHFCVNILHHGQSHIADRFAGRGGVKGAERYAEGEWAPIATGALALAGSLAAIDCTLEEAIVRHSHAILLGSVSSLWVDQGHALVYSGGSYGRFTG